MKTLHTTQNCKYRKFLHKLLKHGRISGRFYKFLCRTFPYRLTYRGVTANVGEVINGRSKEDWVMQIMKTNEDHKLEIKHQKSMMKANIECRKKIGWKQVNE
jgi:hypothetical protein